MNYEAWQWILLVAGAVMIGLSKTSLQGLGILSVAFFANALPARQATGVVLPLLILGDVCGVLAYRRHANWSRLWRLFPWTATGVVVGWLVLGHIDDAQTKRLVGSLLAGLLILQFWRRWRAARSPEKEAQSPTGSRSSAAFTGLLAGFTTLTANAAGPVMMLYLLAMRVPKLEFLGTGAVFFMLLNWFKLPFVAQLGLVNYDSLGLNLALAPALLVGALTGVWLARRINQKAFETVALSLTAVAVVRLLFF